MSENNNNNACPVDEETRKIWLQANQSKNTYTTPTTLSTIREISSIPRTDTESNWIYPSEEQFYTAMQRKQLPGDKTTMQTVIPIHNSINERVWGRIRQWENIDTGLSLTSFKGNHSRITPRAWVRHYILGMSLPFDRHDWEVRRPGNMRIDYVIDFYLQKDSQVILDVRPKLNTLEGCKLRLCTFLGI